MTKQIKTQFHKKLIKNLIAQILALIKMRRTQLNY